MEILDPITMDEKTQFIELCARAFRTQRVIVVQAADSSKARALRKRFYRLRDDTPQTVAGRSYCDRVSFKLVGRMVKITPDVDLRRAVSLPSGVSNGTNDQGEVPQGDRLDDQG